MPLVGLLHASGSRVFVFDAHLECDVKALESWYEFQVERGAAVGEEHRRILLELYSAGRIFSPDEEEKALSHSDIRVVSPNGGPTEWLFRRISNGRRRASVLVKNREANGNLRLILGAGNAQVSMTNREEREGVLMSLAEAEIAMVPDPVVSPGGVIAVSHERGERWVAARVNADAAKIVARGVEEVFRESRMRYNRAGCIEVFRAFEAMVEDAK